MYTVSVIVPIFNAERFLPDLFRALDQCNFQEKDEILLVDNGSTDSSVELCMEKERENPNRYRCLKAPSRPGAEVARNFAVNHARGDLFVFTDSDTKPVPEWIDKIRENIEPGKIIAGKVQLLIEEHGLWECFDAIAHMNNAETVKKDRVVTANMAVLKTDFLAVGYLKEIFSSGDYDWSERAARCGMKIAYVPEALVYHPTRKTLEQIDNKMMRIAYGEGDLERINHKLGWYIKLKYILLPIKLDTYARFAKQLKKLGVDKKELKGFYLQFFKLRLKQIRFVFAGYRQVDPRKMGLS